MMINKNVTEVVHPVIKIHALGETGTSKTLITVEIIEYLDDSVVSKTTIDKSVGKITVVSMNTGAGLPEKTTPFDTFAQIIDGYAEIVIAGEPFFLETGQSIVIPAHAPCFTRPNGRFKMILTVIKNGYD